MTEAVTAHEIVVRRVFDAPREAVWDAWTQPDHSPAGWGPRSWSTPPENISIDVRPGGTMRVTSVSDEGAEMTTVGTFSEVVRPERLAFEEQPEDAWHEGARSVVTFTDLGDVAHGDGAALDHPHDRRDDRPRRGRPQGGRRTSRGMLS